MNNNVYKRMSERTKYDPNEIENRNSFYGGNDYTDDNYKGKSVFSEPINKSRNILNNNNEYSTGSAINKARNKAKRAAAVNAVRTGLNIIAPGSGEVAKKLSDTKDKINEKKEAKKQNEANNKDSSQNKNKNNLPLGDKNAKKDKNDSIVSGKVKKVIKAKIIAFAIYMSIPLLLLFFFIILISTIFKNADSLIYRFINNGDGTFVEEDDTEKTNVFLKYPGVYEKIEKIVDEMNEEYKINIDKYLIISTLIAPIDNNVIVPIENGTCGEDKCYFFEGKQYGWEDFLDLWSSQAGLLAKMQLASQVPDESDNSITCHDGYTQEVLATNDLEENKFSFFGLFNPLNWFKGFRDAKEAELNANCTFPLFGTSKVPDVFYISKDIGEYYNDISEDGEIIQIKDDKTGGVYFWNLVNKGGFIHKYFKDYLSVDENLSEDENYEKSLPRILDIADYIYSYYDVIRKDCEGYEVVDSEFDTINVEGEGSIDFEDQYIGGVMLAEYNQGSIESKKAFAILARTYAISVVGLDGSGTIENSSNNQNYNPAYSKEAYPEIARAVEETRGIILINYKKDKVIKTEYDAFCPKNIEPINGFYYLMPGQKNLPINPDDYERVTGDKFEIPERYLQVPCGYKGNNTNNSNSTGEEYESEESTIIDEINEIKENDYDNEENGTSKAKPGGHGRGASQYGLKYFDGYGYSYESLVRLFFDEGIFVKRSAVIDDVVCPNVDIIEL